MADEDGFNGPRRHNEDDLGRLLNRIRQLERQVAELQRGAPLRSAGIGMTPDGVTVNSSLTVDGELVTTGDSEIGGDVNISGSADLTGTLRVRSGQGIRAYYEGSDEIGAYFGKILTAGEESGTGFLAQEPNGDDYFTALADDSSHRVSIRDNGGYHVISVDQDTPRGITHPAFGVQCGPIGDYQVMPGSDSSSWDTIYEGGLYLYSPNMYIAAQACSSDGDTSGQARIVLTHNDTDYVQETHNSVGFGYASLTALGPIPNAIPMGSWVYVRLQVRRTSGDGDIRGAIIQAAFHGVG